MGEHGSRGSPVWSFSWVPSPAGNLDCSLLRDSQAGPAKPGSVCQSAFCSLDKILKVNNLKRERVDFCSRFQSRVAGLSCFAPWAARYITVGAHDGVGGRSLTSHKWGGKETGNGLGTSISFNDKGYRPDLSLHVPTLERLHHLPAAQLSLLLLGNTLGYFLTL